MGLPWQADTAFCRAGYDTKYDLYQPTFWPARVPNHVLTNEDYAKATDSSAPRSDRLAAFNRRAQMVAHALGFEAEDKLRNDDNEFVVMTRNV